MSEKKISISHLCVDDDYLEIRPNLSESEYFHRKTLFFFVRRGGSSVRQIKHENIFTGVILQQHAQFDVTQNNTILEIQDYINK